MKTLPVFLLSLLAATAFAADTSPAPAIDPHDIEATLVPEKTTILQDEPIYVTFTLHNKSKRDLGVDLGDPLYFGSKGDYDDYFTFIITDAQGSAVPLLPTHGPGLTIMDQIGMCKLAAGGNYTAPLFLHERVAFSKPGDYTIAVSKMAKFSLPAHPAKSPLDYTRVLLTVDEEATATIHVLPPDPEKLNAIADDLGRKFLARPNVTHNDEEEERIQNQWYHGGETTGGLWQLIQKCNSLPCENIIPWLLKIAIETHDSILRLQALRGIGRFDDDTSFETLQTAMATPRDKIAEAPWEDNGDPKSPPHDSYEEYRAMVLGVLSGSKNPVALRFALTYRNDPNRNVRNSVVNMVGSRMKPVDAIPILTDFTRDSDPQISHYAKDGLLRAQEALKASPRPAQ